MAQHRAGNLLEAIGLYRQAAAMRPTSATVQNNLGLACKEAGDCDGALTAATQAVHLAPQRPGHWTNLGNLYRDMGKLDEAIGAYRKALTLEPGSVAAINNLALAVQDAGQIEEAIALSRRAIAIDPTAVMAHSNLLCALHFDPRYGPAEILSEHKLWARQHADPLVEEIAEHTNNPDPERALRIGYVSSGLQGHVVGRFMLPLLHSHDRDQFQTCCYADQSGIEDEMTRRLRAASHAWRSTRGVSDQQLAETVREDRIDILVDLGMHMSGSRLLAFVRKPAPVQVTYLAYVSTTGMRQIDYRLTDPYLDPAGKGDEFYSEKSVRLPDTYWCYEAPPDAGEVGPPPAVGAGGVITFGCLNNFSKVTNDTLRTWSAILRQIPRSRILIHAREGEHRKRVIDLFSALGVVETRVNFIGFVSLKQYFEVYRLIDISLDPFPYCGGTTTCDALWAGVPVVTLRGRTAVGRGGASILSNINCPELIASTPEQYVSIAVGLGNDLPRLTALRESLRSRMIQSPLTDAPRFARCVQDAYRTMWQTWCAGRSAANS
jgi:predicted O-linked N-acetylglucosamine transferase (SPINDLY family)